MYSIHRFENRIGDMGKPVPTQFPVLAQKDVHFRYSEMSMIAGRPGSFKSILALNLLVNWAMAGRYIQYFSADSQEAIVARRVSSIVTGANARVVDNDFNTGNAHKYVEHLDFIGEQTKFVYRQSDMEGIVVQVKAFKVAYGGWPDIIFIDNLVNFVDRPDDWGGMLLLLRELDSFARESQCHICVLHHAKIDDTDAGMPPADHEIQGKLTQIPRLALTVGARQNKINMACVKNTNGMQNPSVDINGVMTFGLEDSLRINEEEGFRKKNTATLVGQLGGTV